MKLTRRKIPARFLETLPEGIKYVHRHGHEYLVVEEIMCSEGHSLVAESVKIHGEPSIRFLVKMGEQEGPIFVDAFWGSHAKLYSFIPETAKVDDICCPECGVSLLVKDVCEEEGCDSKRAVCLHLPGMNRVYVCARNGCPAHRLDIQKVPHSLSDQVSEINYFGAHDDDFFQGI